MRVKNTSSFQTELVRKIIALVRPSGIKNFDVMIKNSKHAYAGTAFTKGSGYHSTASPFIVVRIGKEKFFPKKTEKENGYLPCLLLSREEALAFVLAHELRHLWQANHTKGKIWGARGKYSERDADAFAIKKVRQYRKIVSAGETLHFR